MPVPASAAPEAVRVLAFAGSTRRESFNKKILRIAVEGARQAGGDVTVVDLRDWPLPLMDEDLEAAEGLPANARALKDLFLANQALLIASPEYNSSITGTLKNVIDWVSRPAATEPSLACFSGKVAGLISASPGALGGLRGLVHLRAILGNIKVLVIPDQVAVMQAHLALETDGRMKDERVHSALVGVGRRLVEITRRLCRAG